jgi:HEAT repeat protein
MTASSIRTKTHKRVLTPALLIALASVAGCQVADPVSKGRSTSGPIPIPTQPATPGTAGASTGPSAGPAAPTKQVGVSEAREQAIGIVENFARGDDPLLRANAMEAAGFAPKRLGNAIRTGLTDSSVGVRSVAALAAGKAQMKELREQVLPLTRDSAPFVRASAICSMAKFGQSVDQTVLAEMLLKGSTPNVSQHAAYVLGEIRNPTALPLLHNAFAVRVGELPPAQQRVFQLQLTEAMVKVGDDSQRPALRAALYPSQPEEFELAALAAQALGETADRDAVGQLMALIQYRDRAGQVYPPEMRLASAGSLAMMGVESAVTTADEFATSKEPGLRAQAAHVYGRLRPQTSLAKLAALMDDPDPGVRLAAAAGVLRQNK